MAAAVEGLAVACSRLIASLRCRRRGLATSCRLELPPMCPSGPARARPRGSAPSAPSVDPGAVVEQQAAGRREPAGQHRHPDRVVQPQAAPGVRHRHDAGHHADARAVDLGCRRPRAATRSWKSTTRSVSAIAPADQATTRGGTVRARRRTGAAAAAARRRARRRSPTPTTRSRSCSDLLPMARRSPLAPAGARRRRTRCWTPADPLQVPFVQRLHHADRVGHAPARRSRGLASERRATVVRRTERMVELHEVELAQLVHGSLGARARRAAYSAVLARSTSSQRSYRRRFAAAPAELASSSASSPSRSCQPAVTVATGPSGASVPRRHPRQVREPLGPQQDGSDRLTRRAR